MADDIKLTLTNPEGKSEERTYDSQVWQNMLENIQQQCDDHFENGPKPEREAYTSFLQIGLQVVGSSASSSSKETTKSS